MNVSTGRILTTHVGSLPRPQEVVDLLFAQDRGEPCDSARFDEVIARAVSDVVKKQVAAGIDIVSDGEMSKISYATYIRHRLTGFEGDSARPTPQDLDDFPEYRDRLVKAGHSATYRRPVCKGPIQVKDLSQLEKDIANLKNALAPVQVTDAFLNAASPGTIAVFQPNEFYPSHEAYLEALANAMRTEYEMIVNSGLLLQLDCPDLAMGPKHTRFKEIDRRRISSLCRAASASPESCPRQCSRRPRPAARLLGKLQKAPTFTTSTAPKSSLSSPRPSPCALLVEGANPRHEHEWEAWASVELPENKILVPGVIGSKQQLRGASRSGRPAPDFGMRMSWGGIA